MSYCTPTGRRVQPEFVGVPPETLQLWLTQAQNALQQLSLGANPQSVSYAQGAGSKSVTYSATDIGKLTQRIRDLSDALGLSDRRRPTRVSF